MILDFLFLPMVFLIGLITSYQDLRYGKIKNKWIILGLVWGLGIYVLFLIQGIVAEPIIYFSYIFMVFTNSLIALIVGYLLWYFNLWSAGDAKLFFIFSLILPLEYYWRTATPYFPSFVLLINTFIPALIFLMCLGVFYILKKFFLLAKTPKTFESKQIKKKLLSLKQNIKINYLNYLKTGIGFLLFFLIFKIIFVEFQISIVILTALMLTIVIIVRKFFPKKTYQFFFQGKFLFIYFCIIAFYAIIKYFVYSQDIVAVFLPLLTKAFLFLGLFGITTLLVSFYLGKTRSEHFPFAIFLFFGTILTIILEGSLISFLLNPWPII